MAQDLEVLGDLDEGYDLLERFRLPDGRLNVIRLLQEDAQDFEQIDVHQLKQKYLAVALAPPDFEQHMVTAMTQVATDPIDDVMLYECTLRAADGDICHAKFKHEHGLLAHQRMALGGEHGFRSYIGFLLSYVFVAREKIKVRNSRLPGMYRPWEVTPPPPLS